MVFRRPHLGDIGRKNDVVSTQATCITLLAWRAREQRDLGAKGFGQYAGSTIHEVAQVVAAARSIVPEAGKEAAFLSRAPGMRSVATIGFGPIRGMWRVGDYFYVVSYDTLYKVDSTYTATALGKVTGTTAPVSMADNGTQIFIACNGPSYIYNTSTNVFAQITDADFTGAGTVGYLDGYFVYNEPNSQLLWVTSLLDGTSIDPLDFASAEGSPDGVTGIIVDHRELWVFGTNSIEVWYNSGVTDFPLTRIQGAFNEIGCVAPYSIAKMDNGLFWLGQDARGQGMVYRANGYTGSRISTHAVEWQIQQYGDLTDAIGYTYQQEGHSFYVLVFPSANTTWVYDVSTQAWHERAGWAAGVFTRHRSNCQAFFNNENLVGDFENGNIYAFDMDVFADNGSIQKWLRSWRAIPAGQNNLVRTAHHSLQLDIEAGVGLNLGQGDDPQVMLRWSDDGGHTWSNEHWMTIGRIGEYFRRVIFRRLGMTLKLRDRVYEVSGTDPVKITIMGAELIAGATRA